MKPTIPQGTRDFGAETLRKRNYIINVITSVFLLYGFEPLETPAMENIETLLGKYGDEGDKLMFKILNNGLNHPEKEIHAREGFENIVKGKSDKRIAERALRYDLTIPFARYVATNFGKLTMPYRRFQVQPVWRADRPQKGRYREFYQCDADVAGTFSLIADAEFVCIYSDVFRKLNLPVTIKLNNRKILFALAESCGLGDSMESIISVIDKLDKIGKEKVEEELSALNLGNERNKTISNYLEISGSNEEKLNSLEGIFQTNTTGLKGLQELREVISLIPNNTTEVIIDPNLARGLNYYTGTIYEVTARDVSMGSIGGGGRYDDLTGLFGLANLPGVGISFGVDRIYDVMDQLQLFPGTLENNSSVLFFNMGEKECSYSFKIMQECREKCISCEIYYEKAKLEKQIKYALKRKIRWGVIIGDREMTAGEAVLKDIENNTQEKVSLTRLYEILTNHTKQQVI